jgi:hypothetical protein
MNAKSVIEICIVATMLLMATAPIAEQGWAIFDLLTGNEGGAASHGISAVLTLIPTGIDKVGKGATVIGLLIKDVATDTSATLTVVTLVSVPVAVLEGKNTAEDTVDLVVIPIEMAVETFFPVAGDIGVAIFEG